MNYICLYFVSWKNEIGVLTSITSNDSSVIQEGYCIGMLTSPKNPTRHP